MHSAPSTTWIKRGLHRSVGLRENRGGECRVVKRFRARSWFRRLGDRGRARQEFALMGELHRRGLPVPQPFELLKFESGWEIHYEFVREAQTLAKLLWLRPSDSTRRHRATRSLGALLGRAHAAGLEHGDLHAGNLLLDSEERPWLIDFTRSRLHDELPTEVMERELVALTADAREFSSPGERRRFFREWRRHVLEKRPELELFARELARRIEGSGLTRRRDVLIEHADRWLRDSGLCEAVAISDRSVLLNREALEAHPVLRRDVERVFESDPVRLERVESALPGFELELDETPESIWAWHELGRVNQHALPALRPLALLLTDPPKALYLRPTEATPISGDPRDDPRLAPALDRLHAQLTSRGLELEGFDGLWRVRDEALLLGPGIERLRSHD